MEADRSRATENEVLRLRRQEVHRAALDNMAGEMVSALFKAMTIKDSGTKPGDRPDGETDGFAAQEHSGTPDTRDNVIEITARSQNHTVEGSPEQGEVGIREEQEGPPEEA